MQLLVTGGAGFIGSNFVRYWADKYPEDKIVVYDKLTYAGNLANLEGYLPGRVTFVQADICDRQSLIKAIQENTIDTVVHFAAETHVDRSIDKPSDFIQTNVVGTHTILEVLRDFPEVRLHHVSTDEVYGDLPLDLPELKFTENSPYSPNSPYSASKAGSDHLVRAYVRTFGIKATLSNCSNNYGPYCFPEKLIPLCITRALADEEIPVYGTGEQVRDWIHTADHALGIDLILHKGRIGETYLLGGDGERQNIWVIKQILKILGKSESLIVHVGDRKGHDHRYAVDFTKANTELGFAPQKSIEERLEETVEWYQKNQAWWQESKKQADILAAKYLSTRI